GRSAGNDAQPRKLRQAVDQAIGNSLAQIIHRWVVALFHKWQYRERDDLTYLLDFLVAGRPVFPNSIGRGTCNQQGQQNTCRYHAPPATLSTCRSGPRDNL